MKKFSLILASRERTNLLQSLLASIETTTVEHEAVEVFVGIDNDDPATQEIKHEMEVKYANIGLRFFSRERSKWLHKDYINLMFEKSNGKYVLVLNDDTLLARHGWDLESYNKLESYLSDKPDRVVYASTKDNTGDKRCCCFPLFSREACLAAGWVLPDERPNWGADWDVKQIYSHPKIDRMIELPELEVRHITHHNNTRKRDHISVNIEKIFQQAKGSGPNREFYVDRIQKRIAESALRNASKTKMLVVYNICELAGRENWHYYLPAIHNILNQKFDSFKVAVSGCRVSNTTKDKLKATFGSEIMYNWIYDILPLNVTFNHTVNKCFNICGYFDCVTYIDSGVNLGSENPHILRHMWEKYLTKEYSMVAYPVDTDMGLDQWKIKLPKNSDFEIPLGKATNLHLQLFGREIYEAYGERILPDIFASDTSESIFTFMCAAVGKKWILCNGKPIRHRQGVDGPSVGFRNRKPLLFKTEKNINEICDDGASVGFGYEECRPILKHNPSFYDNDGRHRNPEILKNFIKNNCFIEDGFKFYRSINYMLDRNVSIVGKEDKTPSITCILTSHKKPGLVSEAIDSVLNQSFQNWKLIIVDSGELFESGYFNVYNDPRITVRLTDRQEEARGLKSMVAYSCNEILRQSIDTTLISYLHDDDVLYPNAFEAMMDFVSENPNVMALYGSQDFVSVDESKTVIYLGENVASDKIGISIGGFPLAGNVNYLQFAHRPEITKDMSQSDFWPEEKANERSSAGLFMDKIGSIFPVLPLDAKIGMARQTHLSVHSKSIGE